MAILKIEDLEGIVETLVFPRVYSRVAGIIKENNVILLSGRVNLKEETPKIIADDISPIENAYNLVSAISIDLTGIKETLFSSLKEKLMQFSGLIPIYFNITTQNKIKKRIIAGDELFVNVCDEFLNDVENLLGEDKYSLILKERS
jgi:DNA polymerase-3 subunit alpha